MSQYQYNPMDRSRAYTQSFAQGQPLALPQSFGGSPYPGLGGPASQAYFGQSPGFFPQSGFGGAPQGGSVGGGSGLGQFKTMIDRFGGIEGMLGTMTKVQKIVQSFQQMSPLLKLMAGSFFKGGKATATNVRGRHDGLAPIRKRRRRKKQTARGKRPAVRSGTQKRRRR